MESNSNEGLKAKYFVQRLDGKSNFGEDYFVLRLDEKANSSHRTASLLAIKAYADSIKNILPPLTKDLYEKYPLFLVEEGYVPINESIKPIEVNPLLVFPHLSPLAKAVYSSRYYNTVLEFVENIDNLGEVSFTYNRNLKGEKQFSFTHEIRRNSLSQYLSFKIVSKTESIILEPYAEILAKFFSKLVREGVLGYKILAPISVFKGAPFNSSTKQSIGFRNGKVIHYPESMVDLRNKDVFNEVVDFSNIRYTTFMFMFVFPTVDFNRRNQSREVEYDLGLHKKLNDYIGFEVFSEEGKCIENEEVWDKMKEYGNI